MSPARPRHVALVGPSGTGKSTVAPLLAERLGFASVDIDRLVEQRRGTSVGDVFRAEGEEGFRRVESELLHEALAGPPVVVATGGGIVTTEANRRLLREQCHVVWLRADPEVLLARLSGTEEERPLLGDDPATTLRRLAQEREAAYREVSGLELEVAGAEPAEVADRIVTWLADDSTPTAGAAT